MSTIGLVLPDVSPCILLAFQKLDKKIVLTNVLISECTDSIPRMQATRSCCNVRSSEKKRKKHDQLHYQTIVVHHRSPPTLPAVCSQQIQVVPCVRVRRRRRRRDTVIIIIVVVVCGRKTDSIIRSLQKCRRVTKTRGREGRVTALPRV